MKQTSVKLILLLILNHYNFYLKTMIKQNKERLHFINDILI